MRTGRTRRLCSERPVEIQSADVGAVVLTTGESTTDRAIATVRAQTAPIAELALVEGVTPFHRALNQGVDALSTPYFLQVDADMVLDRDCAACLRAAMRPGIGIVAGALRDPLMGKVGAVKLFRRECFDAARPADVLAPEVDFQARLAQLGWDARYLVGIGRRPRGTYGLHDPDYGVAYAYGTYYLLGARYADAPDPVGLAWRIRALRRSKHVVAPVARAAMAAGVFGRETRDAAKPRPSRADEPFLNAVTNGGASREPGGLPPLDGPPAQVLDVYTQLGAVLRSRCGREFGAAMRSLARVDESRALIAEVGLGRGALARTTDSAAARVPAVVDRLAA